MTSLWKKEGNRHVRCDTGCDFSWLWFVMPFVDGGSFRLFSLRLMVLGESTKDSRSKTGQRVERAVTTKLE